MALLRLLNISKVLSGFIVVETHVHSLELDGSGFNGLAIPRVEKGLEITRSDKVQFQPN